MRAVLVLGVFALLIAAAVNQTPLLIVAALCGVAFLVARSR